MLATSVFSIPILLPINPPTILDLGSRSLGPGATCQLPTRPCIYGLTSHRRIACSARAWK